MSNPTNDQAQEQNMTQESAAETELHAQLETARAEIAELKDRYLRVLADMDNFRKQQERRASDRVHQEKKTLLLRIVEVMDDLDRALSYQEVADRDSLLGALRHTQAQLTAALQQEGVTSFPATGEAFDPHVHEAVERVDNSGKPEGEVVHEMQKGYRFGDELLRPARVHVSSGQND
jgi:molecular chaperone GrpE